MKEYGKYYRMSIISPDAENASDEIAIESPFAIEFKIVRNNNPCANTGLFRLYNIESSKRNQIYKDRYKQDQWWKITFSAGYGDICPIIFQGSINEAASYKKEQDIVTEIKAYEGAYDMVNSFTSDTCPDDTLGGLIKKLARDLRRTSGSPVVGNFEEPFGRGNTALFGNTWDLLMEYTGARCFIDNDRLLVLKDNEAIEGDVSVILDITGIQSGYPKRAEDLTEFDLAFEPRFIVGQVVEIESQAASGLGTEKYMITEIEHTGTISRSSGTEWLSKITVQRKKMNLRIV
jgi:hypothetical protein